MENSSEKKSFLPFNAINEFMLDDFRQQVIENVLNNRKDYSGIEKAGLEKFIKHTVSVPGFRNPNAAPSRLLYRGVVTTFEKNPEFAAIILQIWMNIHADTAHQVFDLLTAQGWEILPIATDRTKLPGFLTDWPDGSTFDSVYCAYQEKYPESATPQNDIALMTVWLSGRLPLNTEQE